MKILRGLVLSLIIGALFGWAFSTRVPAHAAALGGTAVAAYMYGSFVFIDRADRRGSKARRTEDDVDVS